MLKQAARVRLAWAGFLTALAGVLSAKAERIVTHVQHVFGMHMHLGKDGNVYREIGPASHCPEGACQAMAEAEKAFRDRRDTGA